MEKLPSLTQIRAEIRRRATERALREVQRDADRVRARCQSLAGFIKEAWPILEPGRPYIHGWHIDALCRHLEAVTQGRINRVLINVPPGTMKSLAVGVFWPAWEWGPAGLPAMRYLTTSYSDNYVKRDSRRMRDLVSSEWYQSLWGDTVQLTRTGETSFSNSATGFREGVPFASLTAGRGDRLIIDDPHSTETAESEAERMRAGRIFRESVPTRLNDPEKSAIVIIMQRLHERDVSGLILQLGLPYQHLMLPMEFEPDRRCRTAIGFEDPRSLEGELLFPERFPREVVERDKIPMGSYAVAGQFQQRPAPREGGMFKRGWFDIVGAAPIDCTRVRGWDLAATKEATGNEPAYTAGVKLARDKSGIFYIEDVRRFRGTGLEVERAIRNAAAADGQETRISIPQDPGQAGKVQAEYLVRALAGYRIRTTPESGAKEQRAEPAAAQAEAGNVRMVRGPWNDDFLQEAELFPNGQFKDQVDALSRAFAELTHREPQPMVW